MKVRDECECAFYFLCKIHPEEDDYGFQIEEKNKAIVVKSVTRGSHAEVMASKLTNKHTHTLYLLPAPGNYFHLVMAVYCFDGCCQSASSRIR